VLLKVSLLFGSYAANSTVSCIFRPINLRTDVYCVPMPSGPSVVRRTSNRLDCYCSPFRRSPTKAKTSSMGRSITIRFSFLIITVMPHPS
jgi:hypothetical protein